MKAPRPRLQSAGLETVTENFPPLIAAPLQGATGKYTTVVGFVLPTAYSVLSNVHDDACAGELEVGVCDGDGDEPKEGVAEPVGEEDGGSGGSEMELREASVSHAIRYEYVHGKTAFLHVMWTHTAYGWLTLTLSRVWRPEPVEGGLPAGNFGEGCA